MTFLLLFAIASICSHGQNPITSVITPQTRFTKTFTNNYYIAKNGNLYERKMDNKKQEYSKELILTSVKENRLKREKPFCYKDFLGKPLGHLSHELLHTHYTNRKDPAQKCEH